MAAVLAALGVRSLVHWLRRPLAGSDSTDHFLFGLFVLGRAGVWWSLAGLFGLYASVSAHLEGRAFTDEVRTRFWWYPMIVIASTLLQFLAGFLIGRRGES